MLTVLGRRAEFGRGLIGERTSEGRARAKVCGMKMGHKPQPTERQQKEALRRRDASEPMRDVARS